MKTNTSKDSQENKPVYVIPTDLAAMWGVPVRKMNKILMQQGFQEKTITKKQEYEWKPIKKGETFAKFALLESGPPIVRLFWDRSILDDLDETEDELLNSKAIQDLLKAVTAEQKKKKDINICRTCSVLHEGSTFCKFCGTPIETVPVPAENPRVNSALEVTV